jgi:hypothetical protein
MNNETTIITFETMASRMETLRGLFVGEIAAQLADYATMTNRRIGEEWNTASAFEYGYPTRQDDGSYRINVWHEMSRYTFRLHITFNAVGVTVYVQMVDNQGESTLMDNLMTLDRAARDISMEIHNRFERKVTGRNSNG